MWDLDFELGNSYMRSLRLEISPIGLSSIWGRVGQVSNCTEAPSPPRI